MNNKAQAQSQMFIYILSIIIIGLLLFFGIKWIGELIKTGDKIDSTKLTVELENAFNTMRPQYGSAESYNFYIPRGIEKVCFVDSTITKNQLLLTPANYPVCDPNNEMYDSLICLAWKDNASSILFSPSLDVGVNLGHIEIIDSKRSFCYDVTENRKIKLKLIGLGDAVRVELI
ncbi:hypothetical protein HN415_09535 [Candidatus Woesearchaeota archaeon]|jgi:hypothetical protein|nr:hypothetical protein [Candidatus Woesearchaeota archaeon]